MTLPPLASIDDVEALLAEPLTGRQRDRAAAVLAAVSAEARAVTGREWITPGPSLTPGRPDLLGATVARAAERAIRNPQGLSNERLGDYGRGFAPDGPAGVYLTDGERAALAALGDLGDVVSVPVVRDVVVSDATWQLATGTTLENGE